jgi:hypothetical protein
VATEYAFLRMLVRARAPTVARMTMTRGHGRETTKPGTRDASPAPARESAGMHGGRPEAILALQRSAGNAAVTRLLQREPTAPGAVDADSIVEDYPIRRGSEDALDRHVWRRDTSRGDVASHEVYDEGMRRRTKNGLHGSVLGLQALAGDRAVTRLLARSADDDYPDYPRVPPDPPRPMPEIVRDLEATGRAIRDVVEEANDILEELGEARIHNRGELLQAVRDLLNEGEEAVIGVHDALDTLIKQRDSLLDERARARETTGSGGGGERQFEKPKEGHGSAGEEEFEAPQEGKAASEKPPAASGRDEPRVAEPGGAPHLEVEPGGGGVESQGEGMAPGAEGKAATAGAVEGGAVAGEQKGIEKLEHAEDQKAEEDLKRCEPIVRELTAKGNWVILKSWFDAPRAPNITAGVYKERSDVGEFLYTTIQSGATRDEALRNEPSYLKQVDYGIEEAPAPITHSKDRKTVVRQVREVKPDPPGEQLISAYADFIGTYHPSNLDQEAGDITPLRHKGWHRELKLRAGSSADPSSVVQMWTVGDGGEKREWQTVWTSGNDPVKGISALFIQRAPDGTALYSILSEIRYMYTPGGDRIFEHAKGKSGEGPTAAGSWSAVFTWTQANQSK